MDGIGSVQGLNIVVYDLEIENPVDGRIVTWDTPQKMGISVACLKDYRDGDMKVYLRDNLMALTRRLNEADLVVAFNHIKFDNQVLRASGYPLLPDSGGSPSEHLFNYDMLQESKDAIGWKLGDPHKAGLKLDDHLRCTFGPHLVKTMHGSQAPLLFQRGQMSELITYCLGDVRREAVLFERAWLLGEYNAGVHGLVKLRDPRTAMRCHQKPATHIQVNNSPQSVIM